MPLIRLNLNFICLLCLYGFILPAGGKPPNKLEDYHLERLVGNRVKIGSVQWKAREPLVTNLLIYSVALPEMNENVFRRVAEEFSLKGEIRQIPSDREGAPGFWIQEFSPTNPLVYRSLYFSLSSGKFGYHSGDTGHRWDKENHRPLAIGIPDKEEAKQKALKFLPTLGITTNNLEHTADGRLNFASSTYEIGYTDRITKERKKAIMSRSVSFYQKMPHGAYNASVGDGGKLRFTFLSKGEISEIEWLFRKLEPNGSAKPKTSKEIVQDIERGNVWTWHQKVPLSITITNCELSYPQGNSQMSQLSVWPFYMLTGSADKEGAITLFIPLYSGF